MRFFRKYTYYLQSILRLLAGIVEWPRVIRIFLGGDPEEPVLISLRLSKLRFSVRGKMDIWSVKETCLDRFYEKYGTAIQDGWTVIDVGAGVGDFTLYAAKYRSAAVVHAYEPFPDSFLLLQKNAALNEAGNVSIFNEAVWGETGSLVLDISGDDPLRFGSYALDGLSADTDALSIPCLSLEGALARLGDRDCDLLKMDCEGAEYPILFTSDDRLFPKIRRLVMEYHDQEGGFTHRDLLTFFGERGYRVRAYPNQVYSFLGYLYAVRQ